jgi:hypothetical protein
MWETLLIGFLSAEDKFIALRAEGSAETMEVVEDSASELRD